MNRKVNIFSITPAMLCGIFIGQSPFSPSYAHAKTGRAVRFYSSLQGFPGACCGVIASIPIAAVVFMKHRTHWGVVF